MVIGHNYNCCTQLYIVICYRIIIQLKVKTFDKKLVISSGEEYVTTIDGSVTHSFKAAINFKCRYAFCILHSTNYAA